MGTRRSDPVVTDPAVALSRAPVSIKALVKKFGTAGDPLVWTLRQLPGGFTAILRLLRLSSDPAAVHLIETYDRLCLRDNARVSVGRLLDEAQMAARDFVGLACSVAYDYNIVLGKAIAAVQYPKMMKVSMQRALEAEATDERKMHLQASGYLPTGKGIQIGIANNHLTLPDDRPPAPGRPASFDRTARQIVRDLPPSK